MILTFPSDSGNAALIMLGMFWLFGPGLLVPMLFRRGRGGQDKLPKRFEHLRATSTYRPPAPTAVNPPPVVTYSQDTTVIMAGPIRRVGEPSTR